jgi:hypothetical protein
MCREKHIRKPPFSRRPVSDILAGGWKKMGVLETILKHFPEREITAADRARILQSCAEHREPRRRQRIARLAEEREAAGRPPAVVVPAAVADVAGDVATPAGCQSTEATI